jgi:GNAT superfamily N-acetyltransferase
MITPKDIFSAALAATRSVFAPGAAAAPALRSAMVPIQSLGENQRHRIAKHLLALDSRDRYLRFGSAIKDERIRSYVDGIDFVRDDVFGIFNRKLELIAVAHLAYSGEDRYNACAEFGVSVLAHVRGRGYGARLFDRAAMHARNEGVQMMFIHALSENSAMLSIARKAGAVVERDGSESEAHLRLPAPSFDSRLSSMLDSHFAHTDYQLKLQAKQFWSFLATVQEVRAGVLDAQTRSSP